MMRVCHVVRQFWPSVGGLEDVVIHLARQQAARGWDVEIVTLDRIFAEPDRHLAGRERFENIDIRRLAYFGSSRYPVCPQSLPAIRKADILHVHAVDFFFDFFALTRFLHGKPMLATTHGGFFHTQAHARLKQLWFDQITRRSIAQYDAIVACGEADEQLFLPLANSNLHRIDNGVDIDKFAGLGSAAPVKKLVTIGRFSVNKRLDRVLDVLVRLVEIDRNWQLDIIGNPSDWSLAQLRSEIAARGLDANVHVAAGASNAEAAARIAGASYFVSASEHEGFGLAAVEALSAGLTPILQDNAAYLALQKRCPLVQIADFADSAATAAQIECIAAIDPQSYRLRQQSARAAAQEFAWPRVADLYLDLYGDVLNRTKRGARGTSARSRSGVNVSMG